MTQIIHKKIETWNRTILRNLFWLIPMIIFLLAYIAASGTIERYIIKKNQIEIKKGVILNVKNDFDFKKRLEKLDCKQQEASELLKKLK